MSLEKADNGKIMVLHRSPEEWAANPRTEKIQRVSIVWMSGAPNSQVQCEGPRDEDADDEQILFAVKNDELKYYEAGDVR